MASITTTQVEPRCGGSTRETYYPVRSVRDEQTLQDLLESTQQLHDEVVELPRRLQQLVAR